MKLDPRIVATDLDGTLLNSEGLVSERTRNVLGKWTEDGRIVIGVTARAARAVRHLLSDGISGLVICANGAVVFNLDTHEVVASKLLPRDLSVHIIESIKRSVPGAICAAEFPLTVARDIEYQLANPPKPHEERVGNVIDLIDDDVAKIIVRHQSLPFDELLSTVKAIVGEVAAITHSTLEFIEISAPGINKAVTLGGVVDSLGVTSKNVIAFGDMPNDIPMLSWAEYSVAMANAHSTVKRSANEVTLSNDEDGVAVVLERLIAMGNCPSGNQFENIHNGTFLKEKP